MNCIDAIEGTAKTIIENLHQRFVEFSQEDSEHIRNLKSVIEAAEAFVREHPEIAPDASVLRNVLIDHGKQLWLAHLKKESPQDPDRNPDAPGENDAEYHDYCFNHLYHHGTYPP